MDGKIFIIVFLLLCFTSDSGKWILSTYMNWNVSCVWMKHTPQTNLRPFPEKFMKECFCVNSFRKKASPWVFGMVLNRLCVQVLIICGDVCNTWLYKIDWVILQELFSHYLKFSTCQALKCSQCDWSSLRSK